MNAYIIFFIILVILFTSSVIWIYKDVSAEPEQIGDEERLLSIIALAESSNGKFKTGDKGKSIGIYQIGKLVLEDYNKASTTCYPHKALYDDTISCKIAKWHMKRIIKRLKKKDIYCTARVVYVWNAGYSSMYKKVPKCHKNIIYDAIYESYWRKRADTNS